MSTAIQYDPATKTGIIEIGFRGTVTVLNAAADGWNFMMPIGSITGPQAGDSLFSPTFRWWRGHPFCAFIPYCSACPNFLCDDVCAFYGCPCCFKENDIFQVSLFLLLLLPPQKTKEGLFCHIFFLLAYMYSSPCSR